MSEKFSIEDKTEELVDSMAKFDERNFALQSRIGNLENILRQQIGTVTRQETIHQDGGVNKSAYLSWRGSKASFINTEDLEGARQNSKPDCPLYSMQDHASKQSLYVDSEEMSKENVDVVSQIYQDHRVQF